MFNRNAALERYNYYNDSRVRTAMYTSCWKVVHQEAHESILSFDSGFLESYIYEAAIEAIIEKWADGDEDFAQAYREARAKGKRLVEEHKEKLEQLKSEHGAVWKAPEEEGDVAARMLKEQQEHYQSVLSPECSKLWDKAVAENSPDKVYKDKGFQAFQGRGGEVFDTCLRVRCTFEVCGECGGSGKVVDPRIDAGGLCEEELYHDEEFAQDYWSGRYDINCPSCNGLRVQAVPELPEWIKGLVQDWDDAEWESINEQCAELRMGA